MYHVLYRVGSYVSSIIIAVKFIKNGVSSKKDEILHMHKSAAYIKLIDSIIIYLYKKT